MANIKRKTIQADVHETKVTPVRKLWLSVLMRAENDAKGCSLAESNHAIYGKRNTRRNGWREFNRRRAIWWMTNEASDFLEVCNLAEVDGVRRREKFRKKYPSWSKITPDELKKLGARYGERWNTDEHCWALEVIMGSDERKRDESALDSYMTIVKDIQESKADAIELASKHGMTVEEVDRIRSFIRYGKTHDEFRSSMHGGFHKATDEVVRQIRASGGNSQELSKQFNMTRSAVNKILANKSHFDPEYQKVLDKATVSE